MANITLTITEEEQKTLERSVAMNAGANNLIILTNLATALCTQLTDSYLLERVQNPEVIENLIATTTVYTNIAVATLGLNHQNIDNIMAQMYVDMRTRLMQEQQNAPAPEAPSEAPNPQDNIAETIAQAEQIADAAAAEYAEPSEPKLEDTENTGSPEEA